MAQRIKNLELPADNLKDLRRALGFWLKNQREDAGLTQAQLADLLELRYYSFISQVENGTCRIPQDLYEKWADGVGVPRDEFARTVLEHVEPGLSKMLFPQKR